MPNILLIISGGIAAYKTLLLIRELRSQGYEVQPVMTRSAHEFVTPLSVSALAENTVRSELFDLEAEAKIGHIELARSADLIVVAPATANLIGKYANGLADDLASTLLLANIAPVIVAPAMNVAMWQAAATHDNVAKLRARGVGFVGPNDGGMACGEFGPGRFAEPDEIMAAINAHFANGPLAGKHFIVTSGPTHEPIDPVRYIANRSSGKQGTAIAAALRDLGAKVSFITGPAQAEPPRGVDVTRVETAQEMYDAVMNALPADGFVGAAAVADWRVLNAATEKGKKTVDGLPTLEFGENLDILAAVSMHKSRPDLVIGFAAETQNVLEYARAKRERKSCDWIIANDVSDASGVMGGDENAVHIVRANGVANYPRLSKAETARRIGAEIADYFEQ